MLKIVHKWEKSLEVQKLNKIQCEFLKYSVQKRAEKWEEEISKKKEIK